MRYRPEIDGLRAVAVVPVILFHAWPDLVPQGYLGVDVFFVLSGFLITSLLLEDHAGGRYSLLRFYERRARRILPALCLVVLCTIPLSFAVMLPSEISDLSESIAAVSVFLSNLYFLSQVNYFAPASEVQPLLHTWSLAVEEQFYLVFPPLLALLWRRGARFIFAAIALFLLLSLAFAAFGAAHNPGRNFFFTLSRAWELLAGALVALLLFRRERAGSGPLALLGLLLIIASMLLPLPRGFPFDALAPVAGTALVLIFAAPQGLSARLLSLPLLRGIGLISYSAYLWHQPLFAVTRLHFLGEPPDLIIAGLILLVFILATLSWAFVEQPFRRRQNPWLAGQRRSLGAAVLALVVMFGIGLIGRVSDGADGVWRLVFPERAGLLAVVEGAQQAVNSPDDDGLCRFNSEVIDDTTAGRLRACAEKFGPGVVITGDSHAVDLFGLAIAGSDLPFIAGLTRPACRPPIEGDCPHAALPGFLAQSPGTIRLVLYEVSGLHLMRSQGGGDDVQARVGRLSPSAPVPDFTPSAPAITAVLDNLRAIGAGAQVVLITPRIEPLIRIEWLVRLGCDKALPLREGTEALSAKITAAMAEMAGAAGITWLDQLSLYDLSLPRDYGGCDGLYWNDGDHLSALGEQVIGARADIIAAAENALKE